MRSALIIALILMLTGCSTRPADPLLSAAVETGRWLEATALETGAGTSWAAVPAESNDGDASLYAGSPGVVLFLLELYRATGDTTWLESAQRGAAHLIERIDDTTDSGLYTGLAGIGFVLLEVHETTGDVRYHEAVRAVVERLERDASEVRGGLEWSAVTDIISGSAGTGLFLLDAAQRLDLPEAKLLAVEAGNRLLTLARPAPVGLHWMMSPEYARDMPNFSHGTAGVAYFLARLYSETNDRRYLEAAIAGVDHLTALAGTDGFVHHHTPGGEDLDYLGWCHGPPGTLRLYRLMHELTGEPAYAESIESCASALIATNIPEARPPGYWNNVGQCCGSAGIAEFFIELYGAHHNPEFLAFAERLTRDLLDRATIDERGRYWIQAEHRADPDLLQAQTGYMQGAAGIGMMLLHLREARAGRSNWIRLPDSPFAGHD